MPKKPNTDGKLIMVINDTVEILELFEEILVGEGYRVSLHSYHPSDLQDVKKVMPELIISDHSVNHEDAGWQFIQKIKMSADVAYIPIILCTTNLQLVRNNEGHFGVKGIRVLAKPFNIDDLIIVVKEAFEKGGE